MVDQDDLNYRRNQVADMYRMLLGRDAEAGAVDSWLSSAGNNLDTIRSGIVGSAEFQQRQSQPPSAAPVVMERANPQPTAPTGGLSGISTQPQQPTMKPPAFTSDQQANGYGLPPGMMPYYGPMNPGAVDYGFGMQGMYGMMPPWMGGGWGFGGGLGGFGGGGQWYNQPRPAMPYDLSGQTGAPFNAGVGTSNPTQFNYQAGDRTQEYAGAPSSNPMDTGRGFGFQFRRGGRVRRYRRGGLAHLAG